MAASSLESLTGTRRGILRETVRRSKTPRVSRGYRDCPQIPHFGSIRRRTPFCLEILRNTTAQKCSRAAAPGRKQVRQDATATVEEWRARTERSLATHPKRRSAHDRRHRCSGLRKRKG